jgi:L-asparaginase / beta-aspartyl-peptidase
VLSIFLTSISSRKLRKFQRSTSPANRILRYSLAGKIASAARSSSLSSAVKTSVAEFVQDAGVTCAVLVLDKTGELVIESSARLFVAAYGSGALESTETQRHVRFVPDTIPLLPRHEFMRDGRFAAGAYRYPTTPSQAVVTSEGVTDITALPLSEFIHLFRFTRKAARALAASTRVRRCALASDGTILHIVPLHGLSNHWSPVLSTNKVHYTAFPGYLETTSGPEASKESLNVIQQRLSAASGLQEPFDKTFLGDTNDQNLFARIVRGELEQWRIWESKTHVAFLTPYGNTPGFTVLVPRHHLPSDVFSLIESDYVDLVKAAHVVADVIKHGLGVPRVGIFFEGFEIDYTHVKLIPVHSSGPLETVVPTATFHERYPGFITTQPGPLENNMALLDAVARSARQLLA